MDDVTLKLQLWREHMARISTATPEEKLRAAAAARRRSIEFLRAGVRRRHPDWFPDQIEDEVGLLIHGPEIWRLFRERDRGRHAEARR